MLGNYEYRDFKHTHGIWFGKYQNLSNVLHWHKECELIRIISGSAEIKINDTLISAKKDDCYFCCPEDMHYIKSSTGTIVEIMIFHCDLAKEITHQYRLKYPKLACNSYIKERLQLISNIYNDNSVFINFQLKNAAESILIHIYSHEDIEPKENASTPDKEVIEKINEDFAHISFSEMAAFSGYTRSHFSKKFKQITGIGFAEYLNRIKTEQAILLLQQTPRPSMTEICARCGFNTIRNFNRVFKEITGYAPRDLPHNYRTGTDLRVFQKGHFDPTEQNSIKL